MFDVTERKVFKLANQPERPERAALLLPDEWYSLDHRYDVLHLVLAQMTEDGVPVLGALKSAASNVDIHHHIVLLAGQIVAPFQLVNLVDVLAARLIVSGRRTIKRTIRMESRKANSNEIVNHKL